MRGHSDGWSDRQRGRQTPYGRIDIKGNIYIYIYTHTHTHTHIYECIYINVCVCDSIGLMRKQFIGETFV